MFGGGSIFGGVGGGLGGGFPPRQVFEEQYHCYSVAYADKAHLEVRDKSCADLAGSSQHWMGSTIALVDYLQIKPKFSQ